MPKIPNSKYSTFAEVREKYKKTQILEFMIVKGYTAKELRQELNLRNKMETMRVLDYFKVPKEFRDRDGYSPYSIAFLKYVVYLGLNIGEVSKLSKIKFHTVEEYNKYIGLELRIISDDLKVHHIGRVRAGEARTAKHFTNRYFLAHAVDGGFSMKELCRITWYTPKRVMWYLEAHRMVNYYDALIANNKLTLAKKPCLINNAGNHAKIKAKEE